MVMKEALEDLRFLGNIFQEMEQQFNAANYFPELDDFLPVIAEGEQEAFDGQRSPGGEPWPELAPSTIAKKGHNIILFESGDLEESLIGVGNKGNINDATERGLIFGTEIPYSVFHQDGTSRLPQREHVGMNDETLQVLVDAVADKSVEELKPKLNR